MVYSQYLYVLSPRKINQKVLRELERNVVFVLSILGGGRFKKKDKS